LVTCKTLESLKFKTIVFFNYRFDLVIAFMKKLHPNR